MNAEHVEVLRELLSRCQFERYKEGADAIEAAIAALSAEGGASFLGVFANAIWADRLAALTPQPPAAGDQEFPDPSPAAMAQARREALTRTSFDSKMARASWVVDRARLIDAAQNTTPTPAAVPDAVRALRRFVGDAEQVDLGGGDAVVTTCESLEMAKTALSAAPDCAWVLVRKEAIDWLNGESEFECPPDRYFRGEPPKYWWRSVFREKAGLDQQDGQL